MFTYEQAKAFLIEHLNQDVEHHISGCFSRIGKRYDEFDRNLPRDAGPEFDKLFVALRFWNAWQDARNHDWQYPLNIKRNGWPRLAKSIVADLSADREIQNPRILENFDFLTGVPRHLFLKVYFYYSLFTCLIAIPLVIVYPYRPLWWNYVEFPVCGIALLGVFLYVYNKETFLRSTFWKVFFIVAICWYIVSNGIVRPRLNDSPPHSPGFILFDFITGVPIYYALFRYGFYYLPKQEEDSNNSIQVTSNDTLDKLNKVR